MSKEYPPRPTGMCEPVIRGEMVASDVYDFYINNKLNKAIDEYWQSKYPKFAKGRIKRMRNPKKIQDYHRGYSVRLKATKDKFKIWDMLWYQNQEFSYPFTRWTRH